VQRPSGQRAEVGRTTASPLRPWWRRRRYWVPLAAIWIAAAVALLAWRYWLPQYRPGLQAGESYGVDVSTHQGHIDWEDVARDDIEFAFIKATEGGDLVDARFVENWRGARQAGIDVGAYHFFTLCRSGEDQAANFLSQLPRLESDLAPALDLEFPGNCSERPPVEWVQREVRTWVGLVEEKTGLEVLLYVQGDFDEAYRITPMFDRPVWHRRILRRPSENEWLVWQLSYFADVEGIDGGVDLNVGRFG